MGPKTKPSPLDGLSREEKASRIRTLCDSGFTQPQVADMLGYSRSYVNSLMADPTGVKEDARKRRRHGICSECGAHTFNGGARAVPKRCRPCQERLQHEERYWNADRIIAAIQEWARIYGEPPLSHVWLLDVRREGTPNKGRWPSVGSVQREFGTWSNALEAAGFERRHNYIRTPAWKAANTKWTKEKLIEAAHRWFAKHGTRPTSHQWRHRGPDWPNYTTAQKRFGSWKAFMQAAFPDDAPVSREGRSLLSVVDEMFLGT